MKLEYIAWKVKDSHGNTDGGVINESADTVHVSGLKGMKGESIYFESDFYHLENWCLDHDCELVREDTVYHI